MLEGTAVSRRPRAGAYDLRQATSVVAVGFVQLQRQGGFGVPCIQAHHRQAGLSQRMPVPQRQRAALQADPGRQRRPRADGRDEHLGGRRTLALPERLAVVIDHADRGLLERHVQADILPHGRSSCRSPPACSKQTYDCRSALTAIIPCQLADRRSRRVECGRSYAAAATPLISAQSSKALVRAARYSVAVTCSRQRGKRLLI